MVIREVTERSTQLVAQLVAVWEASVRATHTFLTDEEVLRIKAYVPMALEEIAHLVVVTDEAEVPIGFMGVQDGVIEMLFMDPHQRGKGLGRQCIELALAKYGATKVNVNEQNPAAWGFYERMGFHVYKRTDTDEQGGPYPLLYMRKESGKV